MFLDEAIVEFASGKGGDGSSSFRREKFVPRGGPDGEDGGRGGDVILVADRGRRTLYDFKLQTRYEAESGDNAITHKKGKSGKSLEVRVPVGTVVTDVESGECLADLAFDGARYRICKGGRGGYGNLHYANSVRQAPTIAQKGEPSEVVVAKLELKLLADVGLIGLPNAGKSTLISRISAAKPKIADYPFTTIVPNLGVVSVGDTSFTVADMPGLIEGASEGHGLGHQFLKHVERTGVLVHLAEVDPMDRTDPVENYKTIESELAKYSSELASRPRVFCLSKSETIPREFVDELVERFAQIGVTARPISAVTGEGIQSLLFELVRVLDEVARNPIVPTLFPIPNRRDDGFWDVVKSNGGFEVIGKRIEKLIAMTNLESDDALRLLHRKLYRIGVLERLRQLGVQEGDEVVVGDFVFSFEDES